MEVGFNDDTEFLKDSIKVADEFITSVLFVDDEVQWAPGPFEDIEPHVLDAFSLTREFAKQSKTCSFYHFVRKEDVSEIVNLLPCCDALVLDWKINEDVQAPPPEEEEDDVTTPEGRGRMTISLLYRLIATDVNNPKVIIILTGETDGISILSALKEGPCAKYTNCEDGNLSINMNNFRISIYFKPQLRALLHDEDSKRKLVEYTKLSDVISREMAIMTQGLVSNVALKAVATLKKNTNKLLKAYRREMDPAYLVHRALCTVPDDAEYLLLDTIVDSMKTILISGRVADSAGYKSGAIEKWLDANILIDTNCFPFSGKNIEKTEENRKSWQKNGYSEFIRQLFGNEILKKFEKKLMEASNAFYFEANGESTANEEFAILTHHKSNFYHDGYRPVLTLGSVIQDKGDELYYLCIQQRCDSVRISVGEKRAFLFLPLEEVTEKFSIIFRKENNNGSNAIGSSDKYVRLKIKSANCFSLIVKEFTAKDTDGCVEAEGNIFYDVSRKEYRWILDLKDSHAQKIANEFAANLSRVGIDESEWLRRSGK